ncbi:hypothetical protein IH601_04625 [Candidatus Bipolaricaulota bacterium]|nr:hypothetical protein [Candidatus Bipolaricaulota bacterium]TFH06961.1 MAG: hypothetical protein E4H08_10260 [Candidatus Atribacteria bacterium]
MRRSGNMASAIAIVCATLIAISCCVQGSVIVTVSGVAALDSNCDIDDIRDQAIRDAWRRAAEQGAGLFLHAETRVEDLMLVSSELSTWVDAVILEYTVLRAWEDDLFYWIEIEAEVDTFKLGQTLESLGVAIESVGDPRTAVRISEVRLGERQELSISEAIVREALKDKGFILVEASEASGVSFASLGEENAQTALELAQAYAADVAVVGNVEAVPAGQVEIGLFTWYSARAYTDLTAILRSTGEVLASSYGEATVPALSLEVASVEAIERAVTSALPSLMFEAIANLSMINGSGLRAMQLVVEGARSLHEAQQIQVALGTLREVSDIELRQYGEALTAYSVAYLGPSDSLGRELEQAAFSALLRSYLGRDTRMTVVALDFGSIHVKLE